MAAYSSESGIETDTDKMHNGELSLTAVVPPSVPYDSKAQIVFVFNKCLPRSKTYTVDFVGQSRAPMQVNATRLNECTLSVQAPVYYPPEDVVANIYYGIQRKSLGSSNFQFESRAEILANLLFDSTDPVTFMCEALNISSHDLESLDETLSAIFVSNVPHGFDILGSYRGKIETETYARYPTLLHFGATFGLKKLVDSILHGSYPGVVEAVLLKNCYKMKPQDLAKHYDQPEIQEQLLQFEADNEKSDYINMASDETYEEMGREGGNGYVPMKRDDFDNYMDMTSHEQSSSDGYFSADRGGHADEGGYLKMAGHEDSDCTYLDMNRNPNYEEGSQIYEDMQESEDPTQDPEDRFYEPVESQGADAPPVPTRGSSALYDRPCNLPVSEYPLHRSASNSMNPREANTRKASPKHKLKSNIFSQDSDSQDEFSKDSLVIQTIMEKVRAGYLTQEEADQYFAKLNLQAPSAFSRELIRCGSTSSKISNTSTASSTSSSSHGSVIETSGYGADKEDGGDDTFMSLGELQNRFRKRQMQQDTKISVTPPALPPTDYENRNQAPHPDPPPSPRRAGKSRPKTVPVNPIDVEKAQEKNTPSTLKRRGTSPLPKPPGSPRIPAPWEERRPSLPKDDQQLTEEKNSLKSKNRPPAPPPGPKPRMAPPFPVEERNPAPSTTPVEQRSPGPGPTAPKPMMNIRGAKPTPFAMALKETASTLKQRKPDLEEAPPRPLKPSQRPPLAPPRAQQRH